MPESVRDYQLAEGAPYEGPLGHTLQESIHVSLPSGQIQSARAYTQVNVATDPELREAALRGALHPPVAQQTLAIPYMFHDPVARKFALVLPEALRHRELQERANLLSRLAEAAQHPIPPYVRQARVVFGPDELRAYLDAPATAHVQAHAADLRRREHALLRAAEDLAEREGRLRMRAEDITRREDEFRAATGSYPPPNADDVEQLDSSSREGKSNSDYVLPSSVEELVDDQDVEQLDEPGALPREVTDVSAVVSAPATLIDDPDAQMVVVQLREEWVELAARLDPDHESTLTEPELLCQWNGNTEQPLVFLTLFAQDEGDYARRCVVDPTDPEGRRVLRALKDHYRARVDLFSDEGALIRTVTTTSPRGENVALVLEKVPQGTQSDRGSEDLAAALEAPPPAGDPDCPFQPEPPIPADSWSEALSTVEHFAEWGRASRLEHALLTLCIPVEWTERCFTEVLRDAARFGIAPPSTLEGRAILLAPGASPESLVQRTALGLLSSLENREEISAPAETLAKQWTELLRMGKKHDVTVDTALHDSIVEALGELGQNVGASNDGSIQESVDSSSGDELGQLPDASLLRLLADPESAYEAALVLLGRGEPDNLEPILHGLEHMTQDQVLRLAPRFASVAQPGATAWRSGLRATAAVVRHMSVLLLEACSSPDAVAELEELLEEEPSELWKEVARVLGKGGSASYEKIATRLPDSPKSVERLGYALAHLASHGLEAEVQELTRSTNSNIALAALEAIRLLPDAQNHRKLVGGQEFADPQTPAGEALPASEHLALSQAFWAQAGLGAARARP